MKYLAAYALLLVGGNSSPSVEDITSVITAAGGEVVEEELNVLLNDLEGKDIHELLAKGDESLKSCAGAAISAAPAAAASSSAAPAAAAPVEAPKPKVEEVDALDGGMDMFGGGGGDY